MITISKFIMIEWHIASVVSECSERAQFNEGKNDNYLPNNVSSRTVTSDYKINMQAYLYQCNTGSDIINYNKNTYMHIYYS